MPFYVYILVSKQSGAFYIGQTTDLKNRLHLHNAGRVKSTKNRGPWAFLYTTELASRSDAMALERKLKNFKSRKRLLLWIQNHPDNKSSVGPDYYHSFKLN
jgi:putative endonuclease